MSLFCWTIPGFSELLERSCSLFEILLFTSGDNDFVPVDGCFSPVDNVSNDLLPKQSLTSENKYQQIWLPKTKITDEKVTTRPKMQAANIRLEEMRSTYGTWPSTMATFNSPHYFLGLLTSVSHRPLSLHVIQAHTLLYLVLTSCYLSGMCVSLETCFQCDIEISCYLNWLRMGAMNGAGYANPDGSSCCPSFCFTFMIVLLLGFFVLELSYYLHTRCLVVCTIHEHRLRSTWNWLSFSFTWVLFPIQALKFFVYINDFKDLNQNQRSFFT